MNRGDAVSELRDFLDILMSTGLARYSNPVIEAPAKLNGRDVTSVTTARYRDNHTGPVADREVDGPDYFFSIDQYMRAFRAGDYAAVLFDGAMLQFRYDFERSDLVGHRLCYLPMPCTNEGDLLAEFDPADVVQLVLENDVSRLRLRTPLRFDYSEYSGPDEPGVHLHLVTDNGRLPVFGPLSLGHFVTSIFQTFYRETWDEFSFLRSYRPELIKRNIDVEQEKFLHLSCRHL